MPKISIITTVYNAKDQLPLCVESICKQTFSDFELILVEDGSPNGCGIVCDELAKTDPRIRVIHKPNGGPASASNAGLREAKGEYISFVDSDDLIHPTFLETLYSNLIENDCDISACGAIGIDNEGNLLPNVTVQSQIEGKHDALDLFLDIYQTGTMYGMLCWNKLFKASVFPGRGIRFDESLMFGDDASILHLVYDNSKIFCSNDPLYYYRSRPGSITAAVFPKRKTDDLKMYWDWLCWFRERGATEHVQWGIYRYWHVFYVFYCMATESGAIKDQQVAEDFKKYGCNLRSLKPELLQNPYISNFEKMRYRVFMLSPVLAYQFARLWGQLHKGKD